MMFILPLQRPSGIRILHIQEGYLSMECPQVSLRLVSLRCSISLYRRDLRIVSHCLMFLLKAPWFILCHLAGAIMTMNEHLLKHLFFLLIASLCFHSTGHGDPAILAIEILQVDDRAYYFGPDFGKGTITKTVRRLNCGANDSMFDVDYSGDHWGGDRFWGSIKTFGRNSDRLISTKNSTKSTSKAPNFYPGSIYQTAFLSTDNEPDLTYTMDVDPNKKYAVWLHFAEIDPSVTSVGQRIMDISINDNTVFPAVDIVKMAGGVNSALVLNKTVAVSGRSLTITLHSRSGTHAIISAIEIFEIIIAESKTSLDEDT